jgi:type IV secretory pathway protease TraF
VRLGPKPTPRFVWNVSESVPTGLYRVRPPRRLIVTDLVVAYPPEPLATLLAEGGYLPRGVPLIKRIHWWTREAIVAEAIPPSQWVENQKPLEAQ